MPSNLFVTVGTQLPFDRLVRSVDAWCAMRPTIEGFAQIGIGHVPTHLASAASLTGPGFVEQMERASVVVAHAGMGTIISALDLGKRVIVMPRLARYGEHRSDHQLATVSRLAHLDAIDVVTDEAELYAALAASFATRAADVADRRSETSAARVELIGTVRAFVQSAA